MTVSEVVDAEGAAASLVTAPPSAVGVDTSAAASLLGFLSAVGDAGTVGASFCDPGFVETKGLTGMRGITGRVADRVWPWEV